MTPTFRLYIRLLAALFVLGQFAAPRPAWACSCIAPPAPAQAFGDAGAVFLGQVTGISHPSGNSITSQLTHLWAQWTNAPLPYSFYNQQVTFRVSDSWKGIGSTSITVSTGSGGGDCGYFFDVGQQYVVYAHDFDGSGWQTNICTRTAHVAQAGADLAYLNTQPSLPLSPTAGLPLPVLLGLFALLAMAGGATVWMIRRRRAQPTDDAR